MITDVIWPHLNYTYYVCCNTLKWIKSFVLKSKLSDDSNYRTVIFNVKSCKIYNDIAVDTISKLWSEYMEIVLRAFVSEETGLHNNTLNNTILI